MQEIGLPVPRIHALDDLLARLGPHDRTLAPLRRALKSLTRYAVEYRYPGLSATRRKAVAALRHAENVRAAVRARLGLSH
jgi:HEPN domain-containing protein